VYRGPGKVTFDPEGAQHVTNPGASRSMAKFSESGSYVLRAIAFDGMLQTFVDVSVFVEAPVVK